MSLSLGTLSAALEIQDKFSESFEKFEHKSGSVLDKLSAIEGMVAAFGVSEIASKLAEGFTKVSEAIAAPIEKMISYGEEIQNTSNRTSIAVGELQVLKVAAEHAGAGFESITASATKFQAKLGTGSQAVIEATAKLGLSFEKLREEDPGKALVEVLQQLDKIPNAAQRSHVGMQLLGRGFAALLPVGATIDEIREKMERFGMIMSDEVVAGAKLAGSEIGFLKGVLESAERNLGAAATTSAAFHNAIKLVTDVVGTLSKWVQQNQSVVRGWVDDGIVIAARALGFLVAILGATLTAAHAMYDGWLVVKSGFEFLSIDIRLVIDLFKALIDRSPTEAMEAWNKATRDADKTAAELAKSLKTSNEHFAVADGGISKVMNKLLDFADSTEKTRGQVEKLGKSHRENAPFNGDSQGMKVAIEALDGITAKIDALSGKYRSSASATSEYANKQNEVTNQSHQLQEELDKLGVKYPQLAEETRKISGDVIELTKSWHKQVEEAERTKELEAATQRLAAATDDYDKAMFALNPTTELQNKLADEQVKLKDLEIDKWLKANPLMAEAAAKMHELNHATAELVAEKVGIDAFISSLDGIGSELSKIGGMVGSGGLGNLGSLFGTSGGLAGSLSKVGGLSGIGSDLKDMFSGDGVMGMAKSFLGNFASVLPAASAAVGLGKAAFGLIKGLFGSKPEYEQIADELGGKLGFKFSEGTTKAIEATENKDKVDRAVAELLNLDKIEGEVGSFTDSIISMVGQLMNGIANKTVPAKEGMEELDKVFGESQKAALDAGRDIDAMTIALVTQAQKLGEVTPEMEKYLDAAKALEAEGAKGIASGIGLMDMGGLGIDTSLAGQWGTDAANFFAAGFEAEISSKGLISALDDQKESFDKMWKSMEQSGNQAALGLLAPFHSLMEQFEGSDSSLKGLVTTLEGESKVFKGVAQQGMLTADTFSAMERSISEVSSRLKMAGVDGMVSLTAIHGELQAVIDAHNAYGYKIDDSTQKLIDESNAAGLAFKEDPIVTMTKAIEDLVRTLGGATTAFGNMGGAAKKAAQQVSSTGGAYGGASGNGQSYGPPPGTPGYAKGTGGFVDFGHETLVALHGVEAVVPKGDTSFTGGLVSNSGSAFQSSTSGGADLVSELRAMRSDLATRIPAMNAQAVRDALVKLGAIH